MTTVLATKQNDTFRDNPAYFSTVDTLRIGHRTYAVGGWDHTHAARLVMDGPKVRGGIYTFGHGVVLAANPLPDTKTYVDVTHGDLVEIAGNTYRIDPAPNQNIALTFVSGTAPGCGKECGCHTGSYGCHTTVNGERVWTRCDCER